MKYKSNRVLVLVTRDMTESIPAVVFVHEVPILQSIHGEQAVTVVNDPDKILACSTEGLDKPGEREKQVASMLASTEVDPGEEYARLVQRYGMHQDVPIPHVEYAHGRMNSKQWKDALVMKVSDLGLNPEEEEEVQVETVRRGRPPKARPEETAQA